MGFRWLVNAGLLALPVGTTVGVLLGIDSHRQSTGQEPLFNDNDNTIPGSSDGGFTGGGTKADNGITETQYCQQQVGVVPTSKGSQYMFNPNQWGWTPGDPGAMCMNVTAFHNGSYATTYSAPEFFVTWQYPPGPVTQPVHAFPNVQVEGVLPLKFSELLHINMDMEWTYGVGDEPVAHTDTAALTQNLVNTNVAVDMFLDADKESSVNSSLAQYEVMVWFADFGSAAQPIGLDAGIVTTEIVNSTTFNLYTGQNSLKQNVLTWVATETTEVFVGDILSLLTKLSSVDTVTFPSSTLYLGHLGLGSEAFSSNVNVTFSVPVFSVQLET